MEAKEPGERLKLIQQLLLLSVWLMCIVILFFLVYTEEVPTEYTLRTDSKRLSKTYLARKLKYNERVQEIFERKRLTQSSYPLTASTPYILENPQICKGNVTVLIIVHTAMHHFHRRNRIRSTFGNINLFTSTYTIRIAFLLGETTSQKTTAKVKEEDEQYHDIVQAPFSDTYKNLTLKGVMAFHWISLHCSHAELVLKIDDDVFINIFQVVGYYRSKYSPQERQILCNVLDGSPIMRKETRWRIDDFDLFRGLKVYPPYCAGFVVLMTTDAIKAMFHAAYFTPFFWVDDVYLYGLLPSMAGIRHGVLNSNVTLNLETCKKAYMGATPSFFACLANNDNQFSYFWNRSVLLLNSSMRQLVNQQVLSTITAKTTNPF